MASIMDSDEHSYSAIRLPPLTPPRFSGSGSKSVPEWLAFSNFIKDLLVTHPASEIEKFMFMKDALDDEALRLVSWRAITKNPFTSAWEALNERYENNRLIVQYYIYKLLDTVPTSSSYKHLREFMYTIKGALMVLASRKEAVDSWSPIVVCTILRRFPYSIRLRFEETHAGKELPTCDQVLEFLDRHCTVMEIVEMHSAPKSSRPSSPACTEPDSAPAPSRGNFCAYCNESHSIRQCKPFKRLSCQDRNDFALEASLCLNCLSGGHSTEECSSSHCCHTCGERHHTIIHVDAVDGDPTSAF